MVHTYRILPFSFIRVEIQSLARKITCFKHQKSHSKWSFANWECMQSYRVTGSTHHCFGCPLVKKCTYNTYIYIYTWNPTDLYFWRSTGTKTRPELQSRQGSFGFYIVHIVRKSKNLQETLHSLFFETRKLQFNSFLLIVQSWEKIEVYHIPHNWFLDPSCSGYSIWYSAFDWTLSLTSLNKKSDLFSLPICWTQLKWSTITPWKTDNVT